MSGEEEVKQGGGEEVGGGGIRGGKAGEGDQSNFPCSSPGKGLWRQRKYKRTGRRTWHEGGQRRRPADPHEEAGREELAKTAGEKQSEKQNHERAGPSESKEERVSRGKADQKPNATQMFGELRSGQPVSVNFWKQRGTGTRTKRAERAAASTALSGRLRGPGEVQAPEEQQGRERFHRTAATSTW